MISHNKSLISHKIDLGKPLVDTILINDCNLFVEYEGLQTICFHYSRYGHLAEQCPTIHHQANQNNMINTLAGGGTGSQMKKVQEASSGDKKFPVVGS